MRFLLAVLCIVFSWLKIAAQPVTQTFNYTGGAQTFTVPCASSITVQGWGGGGGGGGNDTYTPGFGGGGSFASSTIAVNPGDVLTIYVGGGGTSGVGCMTGTGGGTGGFGAGAGGNGGNAGASGCSGGGGAGGGASMVYNGGTVIFAAAGGGGGGGGGNYSNGASGGGGDQDGSVSGAGTAGTVGSSGSINGATGGQHNNDGAGGGGGGGGYNGGGAGSPDLSCDCGGSGGGGGQSLAGTINPGSGQTPGNSGSGLLCAGCATGGGAQANGTYGILYITYTPNSVVLPVTANASATSICPGTAVTLTGGGATSYTWTGGVSDGVSFVPASTQTYTVTGSNGLCSGTNTVTVTVNTLPTVTATNGLVCDGSSTTLTAGGASTYTWTPSASLSSPNGSNVTAFPTSTTNYTVTGTDVNGCVNTATCVVTVAPSPSVSVNSGTMCANGSVTLNATGASTYAWSPATGLSATTGSTVTANPSGTTVYTVIGSIGTCTSQATSTVTVNALPAISVNSATICAGLQTATLTASGANSYSWNPATGLSGTSVASVTANPASTTTYTVTGTDLNNCVNTQTATVTVNQLPVVTVTNGTICNGSSVTLTANGAVSYTWSPAGSLSSNTGSNVTASPTTTTNYTVIGIGANGCPNADTASVYVVNNPSVNVTGAAICNGNATTLTATGASTYTWSPSTGLSSVNGSTVTANPGTTQTYTVTGTVGTCTASNVATVTVNPLPVVGATSSTICLGQQTATLTANGANLYSWTPSSGLSVTTGSMVNSNASATTVYTVTGTDGNNCSSTATSTVTVNSLPTITANSASVCAGDSATLSASGVISYTWSPATGLNSTSNNSVTAQPASTTVYTISGTDANTCTTSATSTVSVQNNPVVTVNSASICLGQQTATLNAGNANSYTWSPSTGLNSTSGSSVQANPNITTTYTIVGSVGTCTGTATSTVTVNSLPTISATSTVICNGESTTLVASGANTYTWSTMQQNDSILVNPSATSNYSVAGTDANSCMNFTVATVNVNPLPNVTATSTAICVGTPAILSASGALNYSWTPSAGLSSTVTASVTCTAAVTTTYVVTGTDGNGCHKDANAVVTVYPLPTVTATGGTICKGQSLMLTATGAMIYNWNGPALTSSTSASVIATPNTTATYTVFGSDVNNCKDTAVVTINVNPLPTFSITPLISSDCVPVCVDFSGQPSDSATYTYKWVFGNGTVSSNKADHTCYPTAGTYTPSLTLTDTNGCKNTATALVNAFPVPTADFSYAPSSTTIFNPDIYFNDLSSGANIVSWTWYFDDGDSAQIQNPIHTYLDTGLYYPHLAVVSDHGCWNIKWDVLYIAPECLIYVPNAFTPNGDNTNDTFAPKGEGIYQFVMYIFDRWGNLMYKTTDITKGWDGTKGGTPLEQDVYAWKIEIRNYKGEPKQLSGTVTLFK